MTESLSFGQRVRNFLNPASGWPRHNRAVRNSTKGLLTTTFIAGIPLAPSNVADNIMAYPPLKLTHQPLAEITVGDFGRIAAQDAQFLGYEALRVPTLAAQTLGSGAEVLGAFADGGLTTAQTFLGTKTGQPIAHKAATDFNAVADTAQKANDAIGKQVDALAGKADQLYRAQPTQDFLYALKAGVEKMGQDFDDIAARAVRSAF